MEKEKQDKEFNDIFADDLEIMENLRLRKEELAIEMSNLIVEQQRLESDKSILDQKTAFDENNKDSVELDVDALKLEGTPQQSGVWSYLDSIGKFLSAAWTGLMKYIGPLDVDYSAKPPEPEKTMEQNEPSKETSLDQEEKSIEPPGLGTKK